MATRRAIRFSVQDYIEVERVAAARSDELDQSVREHRITDKEWAERTLSEVLPLWEQLFDAALLVPSGTKREEIELGISLRRYAEGERHMRELFAEGILQKDLSKTQQAHGMEPRQDARREFAVRAINEL